MEKIDIGSIVHVNRGVNIGFVGEVTYISESGIIIRLKNECGKVCTVRPSWVTAVDTMFPHDEEIDPVDIMSLF